SSSSATTHNRWISGLQKSKQSGLKKFWRKSTSVIGSTPTESNYRNSCLSWNGLLTKTGVSAQNAGQAASSAKNLAKERIDASLSSRKPHSSSSRSRFSYKSLPNTCVSCEYR